ncbi:helix-turn-helix domain-containing protein [Lachnospiraceae bacterium 62-35]
MTVTLQSLLEHPLLKGIQSLSESDCSDKLITGVGIMESITDQQQFRDGDFILTSSHFIKENIQNTESIFDNLLSHGCSGLGVRLTCIAEVLPKPFLEKAESCAFPVIILPLSCTVSDFSNMVYHAICAREQDEELRLAASYRALAESLLESHDPSQFLNSISQAIGMPVFLTDENFKIIGYASLDHGDTKSLSASSLFSHADINFLKNRYQEQSYPYIAHTIFMYGKRQNYIVFPIAEKKEPAGYLCLLAEDNELAPQNYRFIFSILSLASMELTLNKLRQKKPKTKMSSFVENVLLNPSISPSETDILCHFYGFDTVTPRLCFVIQPDNDERYTVHQRRRMESVIWEAVDAALENSGLKDFRLSYYGNLILFLFKNDFAVQSSALRTGKKIASAVFRLLENSDIHCHIGISKSYAGSNTIKRCFDQSLKTLDLGNRLHPERLIYSYHDDDVYHFLTEHLSPEQLTKFYSETIKPLVEYEKKYNSDLLSTLHLYYECGQSLSQTAKKLYIHRNTMLYRIDKIEKILDVDLSKTNERFRIQLALYIMYLIQHLQ